MKTVIISLYESFPPKFGTATITFNMARHLPGIKHLIQTVDNNSEKNIGNATRVISFKLASKRRLIKFFSLLRIYDRIVAKTEEIDPDFVILEGGSWAVYQMALLRKLRKKRVRAKIVYHVHNVEYELRKQKENFLICVLTRFAEKILLMESDLSFSVSDRDSDYFQNIYGIRPNVLPTSVDIEKFSKTDFIRVNEIRAKYGIEDNSILFIGSVGYKPNDEAIQLLIEEIMPEVINKIENARLIVLGGNVDSKQEYLINPGSVPHDDIPSFIQACDLCVAPIISGSGTRLKILEYLACGKAVVSTSKGAEGIDLEKGKEIVISNDVHDFSEKIVGLLKNDKERNIIGLNGKEAINKKYSWKANLEKFVETIQGIK